MTTETSTVEPTTEHREQPDGVAAGTLDGLAAACGDVWCARMTPTTTRPERSSTA